MLTRKDLLGDFFLPRSPINYLIQASPASLWKTYPAAATGIPLVGLFNSSFFVSGGAASGGGCDRGSFVSAAGGGSDLGVSAGWLGLGAGGGRTLGRHFWRSFVVGVLASSSGDCLARGLMGKAKREGGARYAYSSARDPRWRRYKSHVLEA